MPKVNFDVPLKDFRDGTQLMRSAVGAEPVPMTLGFCCVEMMLMPDETERSSSNRALDYRLGMLAHKGGEAELTDVEVMRLKTKLAAGYGSAMVSGQCCVLLGEGVQ
jgi:hypothetical protein